MTDPEKPKSTGAPPDKPCLEVELEKRKRRRICSWRNIRRALEGLALIMQLLERFGVLDWFNQLSW